MEIEKRVTVAAPRERVWALLMDPTVMTGAVPGMQSIDVISPTEYVALMKVKISFISARFKLHTKIVEQREPEYLRAEGTGEDASVASSLRQTSEVFLSVTPDGGTELRIKVNVDLLGRLGTFGLSVMKTKADRMWEEFSRNLADRIDGKDQHTHNAQPAVQSGQSAGSEGQAGVESEGPNGVGDANAFKSESARTGQVPPQNSATSKSWVARLLGKGTNGAAQGVIRVEVRQSDRVVVIEWPVEAAGQCQSWLRELLMRPA
jgi:carbon monoxide dehydrogenase subunit G